MRFTGAANGDTITPENTDYVPCLKTLAAIELAKQLLGNGDAPPLNLQFGVPAAIQARRSESISKAYDEWKRQKD